MLKQIKEFLQSRAGESVDLSAPGATFLRNELKRLDQAESGLGKRAIHFVFTGEGDDVLLSLRGGGAGPAMALGMFCAQRSGRKPEHSDLQTFFEQRTAGKGEDGALLYRLGELYAAAWSGHGIQPGARFWPHLPDRLIWLECLVREATGTAGFHGVHRPASTEVILDAEDVEAALAAAEEPTDWLVRAISTLNPQFGYERPWRHGLAQMTGLGASFARHAETVAEILDAAPAARQVRVIELLQKVEAPIQGALRRRFESLWVGSAKTVREAVESFVVADREHRREWIDGLRRVLAEGAAGERLQAVLALGRLAPEDAVEILPSRLEQERSSRVRAEIERILNAAPTASGEEAPDEPAVYEDGLVAPEPRTFDAVVDLPPDFEARLITLVADFNQRARTLHEQRWDRTDQRWRRGERSLADLISADQVRSMTQKITGAEPLPAKPMVAVPWLPSNHLLTQSLGSLVAELPLVGLLRFGYLLGLVDNERFEGVRENRADRTLLEWIRGVVSREEPELSLLDIEAACSVAGIRSHWIEIAYLEWSWGASENPLGVSDESLWPFFLEHQKGLAAAFGLEANEANSGVYAQEAERRAYGVLRTFPRPPARFAGYLWEQALGTSKTGRPLAQACLDGYPNREVPILAALGDGRKDIRATAAEWLGRLRVEEAVGPLEQALAKEKYAEPKAAMMEALEALGVDVDRFLNRKKLLAEAEKGLKKPLPKELEWFPFDQLPDVHWEKNRQKVPQEILRWFIVQSFRLKSPDPDPLLRRYCGLMRDDERQALGMMVLSAWLHQDTLPLYDHAEASTLADQQVAQRKSWVKQHPKYAADFDEAAMRKRTLNQLLNECGGSATSSKGVLAVAAACCGADAVPPVQRYLKQWYGRRLHQCKALVRMLSWIDHPVAIQAVLAVGTRFRTKGIQNEAAACVDRIAERRGWTRDELADRTIPSAGFDEDGTQSLDYGSREFTVRLAEDMSIQILNPAGKPIKSLPAATQIDDADQVKAAKKQLSASRKELKQALALQRERLYEAMCVERRWRFEDWDLYLAQHPIVGRYCQRLVWLAERADETDESVTNESVTEESIVSFRPLADRTLSDCRDGEVELAADDTVRIAHQSLLDAELAAAWVEHLDDYEVDSLFRQFGGTVYRPDDKALEQVEIDDFEGHLVSSFKMRSRAKKLGFDRGPAEDGGWFYTYLKSYPSLGLQAVIEFTGNCLPEENRTTALLRASFVRQASDRAGEWTGAHRPLKLSAIPAILLSETYSDLATLAADGPGFAEDWNEQTQW